MMQGNRAGARAGDSEDSVTEADKFQNTIVIEASYFCNGIVMKYVH
jgi:hypothetical protein